MKFEAEEVRWRVYINKKTAELLVTYNAVCSWSYEYLGEL